MATKAKHVEKANRNANFARSLTLDNQANIEWAFISLFYSGMHYVDAYLEEANIQPSLHDTHAKREKIMAMDSKLRLIYREYSDLKNFSLTARYFCSTMKASDFHDDAVPAHEAIKNRLHPVSKK